MRAMPEIARDVARVRERHAAALATAGAGGASRAALDELAETDAELAAFDDVCMGTRTAHLMSAGLRWGEQMRHPALPGVVAAVRLRDRVEIEGETMTIAAATALVAGRAGRGAAIADWSRGSLRLGDALGLEHPPRGSAAAADDAPAQGSLL